MAIIDANSQFDADSIDNQVVGIAAMVGTHDSGMHRHHKHQLLFAASGVCRFLLMGLSASYRQHVLRGSLQA